MPTRPKLVRVQLENGQEASVGASFAESHELTVLNKPARDARGRVLPVTTPDVAELAGQELDDALEAAGLSKSGKVADKRQRLADHQASSGAVPPGGSTDGAPGAPNE